MHKHTKRLLKTGGLIFVSVASFVAAVALLAKSVSVDALPSLPFGLFTLSAVSLLLSGDGLVELLAKKAKDADDAKQALSAAASIPWHAMDVAECRDRLRTLAQEPNALPKPAGPSIWRSLLKEAQEAQQALLLLVAVLYAFVGEAEEAALALGVIALMILCETVTEFRAKRALQSLGSSAPQFAWVLEGNMPKRVLREDVRAGDLLLLRAGFEVPADTRLVTTVGLEVQESRFTGESAPVHKLASVSPGLAVDAPLAERVTMAFSGTVVTKGHGTALVVATGLSTQLGQLLLAVKKAKDKQKEKKTALQSLLKWLAGRLTVVALLGSILGGLLGLIPHSGTPKPSWQTVVLTILSLAFATIPEELPILIAAVLAVGAQALSKRSVFVKRLRAVEALAFLDTVLTDKTGTITRNELTLKAAILPDGSTATINVVGGSSAVPSALLAAWFAMSSSSSGADKSAGDSSAASASSLDPFDLALSKSVTSEGRRGLQQQKELLALLLELPFESETKVAAKYFRSSASDVVAFLKGAPEAVLARCGTGVAARARGAIESAAAQGLRMVALASANFTGVSDAAPSSSTLPALASISTATLIGVLCFEDPLGAEVPACIQECHDAGIRVKMVSGDHPAAATTIARQAGLISAVVTGAADAEDAQGTAVINCSIHADLPSSAAASLHETVVFARATPLNKLQLVQFYQSEAGGERCVAVTGDGVNDAAALAAADVGIAVQNATDVAREAASMVVVNSGDFSSLILAIREGRRLYANLVSALAFYLGVKLGLLVIMVVGALWAPSDSSSGSGPDATTFLLSPVQIIVLELFMDIGASLSFVTEPAEAGVMRQQPRSRKDRFFDLVMVLRILAGGLAMSSAVLIGFWYTGSSSVPFICFLFSHVLLAFNQRSAVEPVLLAKGPVKLLFSNLLFLLWLLAAALLALVVAFVPGLCNALGLKVTLTAHDWVSALVISLICTWWIEAAKLLVRLMTTTALCARKTKASSVAATAATEESAKAPLLLSAAD